jgi:signal transduction histidine kinase
MVVSQPARGTNPTHQSESYPTPARREPSPRPPGGEIPSVRRSAWFLAATVGMFVVGWALLVTLFPQGRLVAQAPRPQVAVEATSALCQLFGAFVLVLFPQEETRRRLRWVAAGLATMGIGGLLFGNIWPMWIQTIDPNASMYVSLVVWGTSAILLVVGLLPPRAPMLSARAVVAVIGGFAISSALVLGNYERLPTLTTVRSLQAAATANEMPMTGLTAWHWSLAAVPMTLTVTAAAAALYRGHGEAWQSWLVAALVLLAGSQLHDALWPSANSTVLTSAGLLRLAFGALVAVGGILELRRLADERASLLAAARKHAEGLAEVAALKKDFTAMVAHEIDQPIAAVRAWTDVLAEGELRPELQSRAISTIRAETHRLQTLAADVKAIATVDRDDFTVRPRPVPVAELVAASTAHNRNLPSCHPLLANAVAEADVLADPERIGQVLRNLLNNAGKFSPNGSPIEVRAVQSGAVVHIEVVDHGPGIAPGDEDRIFEKYVQGRYKGNGGTTGVGLGLYLSRRIVQAHGSELVVKSTPGGGATFWFDLQVAGSPTDPPISAGRVPGPAGFVSDDVALSNSV